jgi:hypothetical protein
MDTSNLDLTARVEKLEKQNRVLKRAGAIVLLLPFCVLIMGQARPSRTLEAQNFILTDSNGVKRAELAVLNAGPILRFFDTNGAVTAFVSANGLSIFGAGTRTSTSDKGPVQVPIVRASLGVYGLDFQNVAGKEVIHLGGVEDLKTMANLPSLQLFDSSERVRVELSGKADDPGISVKEPDGKAEVSLRALEPGPGVAVSDTN